METSELLADAFGRIRDELHEVVEGLDRDGLAFRPDAEANSIAWLAWHLTRVQDDHISEIAGRSQVWVSEGWHDRFDLPADPSNTGYGHTPEQVGALRPEHPQLLIDYHEAVVGGTLEYLATIDAAELDRIIDDSYDPPVSIGVRLVSVIADDLQHVGQGAYVRGLLARQET